MGRSKIRKEELLKGLTPEQIEKARACKNEEELLKKYLDLVNNWLGKLPIW